MPGTMSVVVMMAVTMIMPVAGMVMMAMRVVSVMVVTGHSLALPGSCQIRRNSRRFVCHVTAE